MAKSSLVGAADVTSDLSVRPKTESTVVVGSGSG